MGRTLRFGALAVALVGGCGSDNVNRPSTSFCDQALAALGSEAVTTSADGLRQVDTAKLSSADQRRFLDAVSQYETDIGNEDGSSWTAQRVVDVVNDICGTDLQATTAIA